MQEELDALMQLSLQFDRAQVEDWEKQVAQTEEIFGVYSPSTQF